MTRRVDFYYDFASPNAHCAAMQLPAIAERMNATIVYKPFLLGGVFKALGTPMTPMMTNPSKAKATQADLIRWASKYGIPFAFPTRFPMNTVRALRCSLALEAQGADTRPFVEATFEAYWAKDQDISDVEVLERLLSSVGVKASTILEAIATGEIKEALKSATDAAIEVGVFGTPSFIIDDDLFWGKDRLDFVEDALRAIDP